MKNRALFVALLALAAGGGWWLGRSTGRSAPVEIAADGAAAPGFSQAAPGSASRAPSAMAGTSAPIEEDPAYAVEPNRERGSHATADDSVAPSDLELYAREPLSEVPHRVLKGWGAGNDAKIPGVIGVYVIVDPSLSTRDLEFLARDIREYHRDVDALTVRILDSEEAATYDRHIDGGARLERHLVATVHRNERLGIDEIQVRGVSIEP
jgi:hypothetical protein